MGSRITRNDRWREFQFLCRSCCHYKPNSPKSGSFTNTRNSRRVRKTNALYSSWTTCTSSLYLNLFTSQPIKLTEVTKGKQFYVQGRIFMHFCLNYICSVVSPTYKRAFSSHSFLSRLVFDYVYLLIYFVYINTKHLYDPFFFSLKEDRNSFNPISIWLTRLRQGSGNAFLGDICPKELWKVYFWSHLSVLIIFLKTPLEVQAATPDN